MNLYIIFKRAIDVLVSFIGVIVLSPFFLLIALLIKATSKGPAVYKHKRVGEKGKVFNIYKFRSMVKGARQLQEQGVAEEELITPVGRFLRYLFLDETLQLFNVLKGDMSLVGPRPIDKEIYDVLSKNSQEWDTILLTKPGLTGLESTIDYLPKKIGSKLEESLEDFEGGKAESFKEHRLVLNKYYAENESFLLDLKIIYYTFILILKRLFSK